MRRITGMTWMIPGWRSSSSYKVGSGGKAFEKSQP
jgi:hypothetical protein